MTDSDFEIEIENPLPESHRLAWMDKAYSLIGKMCREAWIANNRREGYAVPLAAKFLISCMSRNNEHAAKAAFIRLECDNVSADCITWPEQCDWPHTRNKP